MFKKLRIRLTLFNLLIISIILTVIGVFAFMGSPRNDPNSVSHEMLDAALSGDVPRQEKRQPGQLHSKQGGLIYLLVNNDGEIEKFSTQITMEQEALQSLADIVLKQSENSGKITNSTADEFLFLRMILDPSKGQVIVLQEVIGISESLIAFLSRIGLFAVGSLLLVFIASLSITERALIPIKKALEKQIEFTADASHELRTPISVIQTNLEAAMGEPNATIHEQMRWLENIRYETLRMAKLVDDLLTLSRSADIHKTLNKTTFALDEALLEATLPMLPYAQNEGIIIKHNIEENITFTGDRERLKQLAVILLDNAVKYSTAPGKILISAKTVGHVVKITVKDSGEGIAESQIEKIFDRFYRVDKSRSREKGGSGLGLAIAKWIVDEHNGSIVVTGTVGVGTQFTITLPTDEK